MNNEYGALTLPKPLLKDTGWGSRDLIEFIRVDEDIFCMEKIGKKGEFEYNTTWCKGISTMGGDDKRMSLGFKTFPEPLISEFKLKKGQLIYFLHIPKFPNTVFASRNDKTLKQAVESFEDWHYKSNKEGNKFEKYSKKRNNRLTKEHLNKYWKNAKRDATSFDENKDYPEIKAWLHHLDKRIERTKLFLKQIRKSKLANKDILLKFQEEDLKISKNVRDILDKKLCNYFGRYEKKLKRRHYDKNLSST